MKFTLNVNSRIVEVDVDPDLPLLWALRSHVKLTEAAYGCAQGLCDACKVRVDGVLVRSCITPVSTVGSARVMTVDASTLGPRPPVSATAPGGRPDRALR
ncbi:MAG TPA: 2Fe-2S iron-sulfur cluster-binding protein [Usitatibacter sp.]|nr:2Fe-2S iron-sulfur cluster-binding protein [Usitatibacter sp.]